GVGDEHAARPVDPLVAPGIVDLEAFRVVPHDGRLAAHGDRLIGVELFQNRKRLRYRNLRPDFAKWRVHPGDTFWGKAKFFGHDFGLSLILRHDFGGWQAGGVANVAHAPKRALHWRTQAYRQFPPAYRTSAMKLELRQF